MSVKKIAHPARDSEQQVQDSSRGVGVESTTATGPIGNPLPAASTQRTHKSMTRRRPEVKCTSSRIPSSIKHTQAGDVRTTNPRTGVSKTEKAYSPRQLERVWAGASVRRSLARRGR